MFDPHRTRRSERRYYTRKGQVLQASRVNVNPTIDQRLVPIYKNYIIKNNLMPAPNPPPPTPPGPQPQNTVTPLGIALQLSDMQTYFYPFTEFTLSTEPSFTIHYNAQSAFAAVLIFSQTSLGYFEFTTFTFSGEINHEILNNVKCYWKIFTGFGTDQEYLHAAKSLYHTSPATENIFLSFDPNTGGTTESLTISQKLNIAL